jgi:hypothetical protein
MNGLTVLFIVLSLLFVGLVLAMNVMNVTVPEEGFADTDAAPVEAPGLAPKIRAVLEPMTASSAELCALYSFLRQNGIKNAKAGPGDPISDAEAARKVEADFALQIEGGALQCPLLTYPKAGSTDLDWLDFLQKIPTDFGARIVFMALYARDTLKEQVTTLKNSLGEGFRSLNVAHTIEGFQAICTPAVAASRRANAAVSSCTLPEDLSPQQIDQAATDLLKSLVAGKTAALTAKKINPTLDIAPIIKEANGYAAELKRYADKAQAGTLRPTITVGSS